ncbi:hypothetical protein OJAV_G00185750 [Oryzias javanicus]|uniref:Ig-like domain-containing protein n=1 Tax=Oryzias javanicus TaxID=123683 RepID=A0A437CDL0_ORYJA|nr:hypothetical protein OJAV_G00185750 [Oryzias javanicus]
MWTLSSVLFLVLVGSSVSGSSGLRIKAEPGQNVILPCRDPNIHQVSVFEWNRTDLEKDEYVFFYRNKRPYLAGQPESFQNRVFLNNSQMKDGDLSVVLKNLKMNDNGTYECRVIKRRRKRSVSDSTLISTIQLSVSPPPPPPPPGEKQQLKVEEANAIAGGGSRSRLSLIFLSGLLILRPLVL